MYSTKLAIRFKADCVLNVKDIHQQLNTIYPVGYTGLFDYDCYQEVYIQGSHKNVRMAPNKIRELGGRFGEVDDVHRFAHRSGTLVEDMGEFRKRGREPYVGGGAASTVTQMVGELSEKRKRETIENESLSTQILEQEVQLQEFGTQCEQPSAQEEDPLFVPAYSGFDHNWRIVSWHLLKKGYKRQSCGKFREQVLERQNHKCNYCRSEVSFGEYSNADVDHVVGLHAGGQTVLHNLQVLCVPCHRKKTSLESRRVSFALSTVMGPAYLPNDDAACVHETASRLDQVEDIDEK